MDWEHLKVRYLRDAIPIRLGGVAANLARMRSFSKHDDQSSYIQRMISENMHFIEWTTLEADPNAQSELVELQVQLALWQINWSLIWADPNRRWAVGELASKWSDRVLELSGLLDEE